VLGRRGELELRDLPQPPAAPRRPPRARREAAERERRPLDGEALAPERGGDHAQLVRGVAAVEVASGVARAGAARTALRQPRGLCVGERVGERRAGGEGLQHEIGRAVQHAADAAHGAGSGRGEALEHRCRAADRRAGAEPRAPLARQPAQQRAVRGQDELVRRDDVAAPLERRRERRERRLAAAQAFDDDVSLHARGGERVGDAQLGRHAERVGAARIAVARRDDRELVRQRTREVPHAAADGAEAQQRDAQRRAALARRVEARRAAPHARRPGIPERGDLERERALARQAHAGVLHDRPVGGERVRPRRRRVAARRRGGRRGIALEEPADVLDEPAARAELGREEQRGQVRAAAAEQHGLARRVDAGEARHDDDAAALERRGETRARERGRQSVERRPGGAQLERGGGQHRRRHAGAVEGGAEERGGALLAARGDGRGARRRGAEPPRLREQTIRLAGERRHDGDDRVSRATEAIDLVDGAWEARLAREDRAAELEDDHALHGVTSSARRSAVASSARSRSSITSPGSSRPTESRSRPSLTPAARRADGETPACVMLAECVSSVSTEPTCSTSAHSRTRRNTSQARAYPPASSKDSTLPCSPRCWRAASSGSASVG
jgi:hypothetical protein